MKTRLHYQTLLELFKAQELPQDKVEQLFPVFASILNKHLEFFDLTLGHEVGKELFDETTLGLFFDSLKKSYSESSIPGMRSKIHKLRDYAMRVSINSQITNMNFPESLSFILKEKQMSGTALAEKLDMRPCTVTDWISGKINPSYEHVETVKKIEKILDIPEGVLRTKLGKVIHGQKCALIKERERTEIGLITQKLRLLPYSLSQKLFPEEVKNEIDDLASFHKESLLAGKNKGLKRNIKTQKWTVKNGKCSKEEGRRKDLSCFFGHLCGSPFEVNTLQRGLGISINDLSLSLVANKDFIENYIYFRKDRVDKLSKGIKRILIDFNSMISPTYGYLRQRPDIGKKYFTLSPDGKTEHAYSPSMSEEEWKERWNQICDEACTFIKDFMSSNVFVSLVKPTAPIQDMIDREQVLPEIKEMLDWMKYDSDVPGLPPCTKAMKKRDYLLTLLLFLFELRINHYSHLKFDRHLYKADGVWNFKIFKAELKNPEILQEDYVILKIPKDVGRIIDDYIENHLPLLYGAETSKHVFLGSVTGRKTADMQEMVQTRSLAQAFKSATILYLNSKTGFGPHTVRKVVTFILDRKRDLEDYEQSAQMALHSRKTSRDSYSPNQVKSSFAYHVSKLQKAGILEMPKDEDRKMLVSELEYNKLVLELRELKAMAIRNGISVLDEDTNSSKAS